MPIYKYAISLQFFTDIKSKPIPIMDEMLESFNTKYDYVNNIFPIMMCTLNIDKNLNDQLVKNCKNGLMYLTVNKVAMSVNDHAAQKYEDYMEGMCYYWTVSDYNPNKDLDYPPDRPESKDKIVTQKVTIGLMFKNRMDENKKFTNCTLTDTHMLDAVHQSTKHMPLLIEPFTYNMAIKQLVVPPLSSVKKGLEFYNQVKVFYDTPYRYFGDYDCFYLVSSSGTPTKKKGELSSTVLIDLIRPTDKKGIIPGSGYDKSKNCYYVPVLSNDSQYFTNTSIDKDFNKLMGILDSSRRYSGSLKGQIQNLFGTIRGIKGRIENIIKQNTPNIDGIIDFSNKFHCDNIEYINQINTNEPPFVSAAKPLESRIADLIKIYGDKTKYSGPIELLIDLYNSLVKYRKQAEAAMPDVTDFSKFNDDTQMSMITTSYNTTTVGTFFNGVMDINVADNKQGMLQHIVNQEAAVQENKNNVASLKAKKQNVDHINENMCNYSNCLPGFPKFLIFIVIGEYVTVSDGGGAAKGFEADHDGGTHREPKTIKVDTSFISGSYPTFNGFSSKVNRAAGIATTSMAGIDLKTAITQEINESINNVVGQIRQIPDDLRNQCMDIEKSAEGFINSVTNTFHSIESSIKSIASGGFNFGSIADIAKDINMVKDITDIGRTGIEQLAIDINVNKSDNSIEKIIPIRIPDDNPNILKNLKASIENNAQLLTFSKTNMDTSIFSINKEYLLNNYSERQEQNGKFLLVYKQDNYTKSDGNLFDLKTVVGLRQITADKGKTN